MSSMHHYIEIQRVRDKDIVVDDSLTLPQNTKSFQKGDIISITEKIDGANTSIYYDVETGKLRYFSSNQELDDTNHFRGFFQYVQELNIKPFRDFKDYIFYGKQQEGIVIKNQTALEEGRKPHILKYVNPEFDEAVVHRRKRRPDARKRRKEREIAEEYVRMIVTEARVRKIFHKLMDDGVLSEKMEKADLKLIVKYLPKAVYEDCVKEESEILNKAGEHAGKLCGKITMAIMDEILD